MDDEGELLAERSGSSLESFVCSSGTWSISRIYLAVMAHAQDRQSRALGPLASYDTTKAGRSGLHV